MVNPTRTGVGSLTRINRGESRISNVSHSQILCITYPLKVSNLLYWLFSVQEQIPIPVVKSTKHVFKPERTMVTLGSSGLSLTGVQTRITAVGFIIILSLQLQSQVIPKLWRYYSITAA